MEEFKKRYLRNSRKLTDMIPIAIVWSFLIMALGTMITSWVYRLFGLPEVDMTRPDDFPGFTYMTLAYLQFIGLWVAFGLAMVIPKANRPMLKDILPNRRGNSLRGIAFGILAGFACNAVCIALSIALGDVGISFAEFNILNMLVLYVAVLIQSGAEEITDRLFLYEKLRRRYKSPWVAIIVNSLVFMAMHLPNPGITAVSCAQIFVVGVLFSLFVYYFDSLWAAIFFHTTWNYTQNIIFGCPNSGNVSAYSMFRLDAAASGPFFDPVFGVEGSVGAVLILIVLTVAVFVYANKKHLQTQDIWAEFDVPRDAAPSAGPMDSEGAPKPRHFAE